MADTDPGSLDRLHDIAVPPPVPWWPPAPGWYVVGSLGVVLLGASAWAAVARWHRNRYRREALRELATIPQTPGALREVAVLVKRVALAVYPRDRVASLSGPKWLEFLDATGGAGFATGPGEFLEAVTFRRDPAVGITSSEIAQLHDTVRHWIRHHRC